MKTIKIEVENLKCNGCASTIKNKISALSGVGSVEVDNDSQVVTIVHDETIEKEKLTTTLKSLGYPEKGTIDGLDGILTEAKSYVSCAVGKISN